MRRLLPFTFTSLALAFALSACGEGTETSLVDVPGEDESSPPTSIHTEIFDGTSSEPGANPHFFFLNPIAGETPEYSGVHDDDLNPVVTVCPLGFWDEDQDVCTSPTATFTVDAADGDDLISLTPGSKYGVVWKTSKHPVTDGQAYRIAVTVMDNLLGYADVKAYDQQTYNSFQHTDPEGYVAISDNGSLNISFRIEDGALEAEYCDPDNLEDCDVAIFAYEEAGCLRVFDNPGQSGELLGSEACVPANAALLDGNPVQGEYAVILTLEKDDESQGPEIDPDRQIPYFPDLKTDPPGIVFDQESEGVSVVICQAPGAVLDAAGNVREDLDFSLRPFIIFADGQVYLPKDFTYGAPECEGFGGFGTSADHAHTAALDGSVGTGAALLSRVSHGFSRVAQLFLPQPLIARRLHGGLNTTVYDTRSPPPDGDGDPPAAPGDGFAGTDPVAELGAVLDVDAAESSAIVPDGQVNAETEIIVNVLDAGGSPFPFPVTVEIAVSGANSASFLGGFVGNSVYQATYTPTAPGTDEIVITVDGQEMPGPYISVVAPLGPDASKSGFEVSESEAGSPTTVTVFVKDTEDNPYIYGEDWPIDVVVTVTGANSATVSATDDDGSGAFDGTYVATYVPTAYGDDQVTVAIEGETVGSPATFTTAPRPADPSQSFVTAPDGLVDSPTTVSVVVKNTGGEPYDYGTIRPIAVQVSVSGANSVSFPATDPDGDGTYQGTYTPAKAGPDLITATIDGEPVAGTATSEVAPLRGPLTVKVAITGGAPSDGLPVILYLSQAPGDALSGTTNASGEAVFPDVIYDASYTVHLPKRDFDVQFPSMTQTVTHTRTNSTFTFNGTTQPLPAGAKVWRVRAGGNGNAYKYVLDSQSWVSSEKKAQSPVVLGVTPNLATIHSQGENDHVAGLVSATCTVDLSRCKAQAWIGLSDDAVEGTYVWVTGEPFTYANWDAKQPSTKNNDDHVEMNPFGKWNTANGASSTNDGYVAEWKVTWPSTPPF